MNQETKYFVGVILATALITVASFELFIEQPILQCVIQCVAYVVLTYLWMKNTSHSFNRTWKKTSNPPLESGRYWCYCEEQNDLGVSNFQMNCSFNSYENRWGDNENAKILYWTELGSKP